jgi:hypothetical protein
MLRELVKPAAVLPGARHAAHRREAVAGLVGFGVFDRADAEEELAGGAVADLDDGGVSSGCRARLVLTAEDAEPVDPGGWRFPARA